MRDWYKRSLTTRNPVEDSADYNREITLIVNCLDGYPAVTSRAPEDCYPAEADQFDILSAIYEDGSAVPRQIIDAIPDEVIYDLIKEPVW